MTISHMNRYPRDFKATQVFDWESEPADERPTDFSRGTDFGRSTGFSQLSGYGSLPQARSTRRHRDAREGVAKLAVTALLLVGLCGVAMYKAAQLLHHTA